MPRSFRFLHASDFHLDRPPRGLTEVPDHLRATLIDAPYRAAERVFDAALKEKVDFVALAGDLVDPAMSGPRGLVFLGEQFRRLADANIRVYWAGGRGDRFAQWAEAWPATDGVVRFTHDRIERVTHDRDSEPLVQVLGTGSEQRKRIRISSFRTDDSDLFTVAIVHGLADADVLARHAVNYWALGGEHQRRAVVVGDTVAHYCGSPQGRRPTESGPHGCTLVQVDETRRVRTSFIPTDAVRFLDEHVAVGESTTADQLHQIIAERAAELSSDPFGPDLLVAWYVAGSKSLAGELRRGRLATELVARLRAEHGQKRPALWSTTVEAEPRPTVPAERYEEETLLGEFLRTVRHYAETPDDPLDLAAYMPRQHASGRLAGAAALDQPAVRARVLAEVARLGVELLGPQESRP